MESWQDLVEALHGAMSARDQARGEEILAQMRRHPLPAADDGLQQQASARFLEGAFADTFGQLERAEQCFTEAVHLDTLLHGPSHPAVADALHSVGIVRRRRGNLAGAAEAFVSAGEIYEEVGANRACGELVTAADLFVRLERFDEAEELLEHALELKASRDAPWKKNAGRLLHQVYRARKEYREALSALSQASRQRMRDDPAWQEAQAQIWLHIGDTSIVFDARDQAAAAYALAMSLDDSPALIAHAKKGLAHIRRTFAFPLDGFRVVYVDRAQKIAHVAHRERGLFVVHDVSTVNLGDRVTIDDSQSPTVLSPNT
jgi:tetratricopeptide (TPR) repeat protein